MLKVGVVTITKDPKINMAQFSSHLTLCSSKVKLFVGKYRMESNEFIFNM